MDKTEPCEAFGVFEKQNRVAVADFNRLLALDGAQSQSGNLLPHSMDSLFEKGFFLLVGWCINGEKAMEGEL